MLPSKGKTKPLSAYMVNYTSDSDRIITNNNHDPLYPQPKQNPAHHSSLCTARNSKSQMKEKRSIRNTHQASTITKFVGELAKSLAKDEEKHLDSASDLNRKEKISLLKRIIDHYNIKSVEKKYYSSNYQISCRFDQDLWLEDRVGEQFGYRCEEKPPPSKKYEIRRAQVNEPRK